MARSQARSELQETAASFVVWRVGWLQTPLATMLLLFETAAGYALFKVLNKGKIDSAAVRLRPESAASQVVIPATHACSLTCMLLRAGLFSRF